ncbi:hypothetical protein [Microbulbifer sp. GL-2]|uniref:hypothetical protein n=1 Tax=Microbulbifer sp. GL-2 TaxID=2591606 RepID=UPI0011631BBF|nr:hypothetical protein [Microbulbifer sp. GL-2]BBM03801.1 hypothetical protein GL2_38750 [Microbulbifer sp. GL-2]
MYESLQDLLGDLCVDYGFCLSSPFWEAISSRKQYSAGAFVRDVFIADRTGPKDREIYGPVIRKLFIDKFGAEAYFWNRRFQARPGKRISMKEKDIILLEFARRERSINRRNPKADQLRARYRGLVGLKQGRKRPIDCELGAG